LKKCREYKANTNKKREKVEKSTICNFAEKPSPSIKQTAYCNELLSTVQLNAYFLLEISHMHKITFAKGPIQWRIWVNDVDLF
jgi:hypothetical protein